MSRRRITSVLSVGAAVFTCLCWLGSRPQASSPTGSFSTLVLNHVTVVDPDAAELRRDMAVLIAGGRIQSIAQSTRARLPSDAKVINAAGKFLIPGLWDMHVHTANPKREFPMFIANGVLGVRNMHGRRERVFEWRKRVLDGSWIGPQLILAGPLVDGPVTTSRSAIVVRNPEEGRGAVDQLIRAGADFVKVYDGLSRESYFAIAEECQRRGSPFAGHVPWDITELEAARAGQKSLEPGAALRSGSDAEDEIVKSRTVPNAIEEAMKTNSNFPAVIDAIARNGNKLLDQYNREKAKRSFREFARLGTHITPTLVTMRGGTFIDELDREANPLAAYSPAWERDRWKPDVGIVNANRTPAYINYRKREYAAIEKALAMAQREGVRILAGTDIGTPFTYAGFGLHDELKWLVRAGLSPRNALRGATTYAANFLNLPGGLGTIRPGSEASVALLNGNPLENIENTKSIVAVIVKGKLLDRTQLDGLLAGARGEAAAGR